jgi:hypothetical protein
MSENNEKTHKVSGIYTLQEQLADALIPCLPIMRQNPRRERKQKTRGAWISRAWYAGAAK